MPRFEPFAGRRYDPAIDLNAVTAPPYDVMDERERAALAMRTAYNVVRVDLPVDDDPDRAPDEDRYALAARLFQAWQDEGVVVTDPEPSFYIYRMGFHDETGTPRQTTGVLGALELSPPGAGRILPHEHTTPKARSDRLQLLRATGHNLSPIWGLSPAEGLSALCEPTGPPIGRCTDSLGVHHRIWRTTSPAVVDAITTLVASAPVVIADGHHRYETSLAYRDERRDAAGGAPGDYDRTLAMVVELAESQLSVLAIHRLLHLAQPVDLIEAFGPFFDAFEAGPAEVVLTARMVDAGALGLVLPDGSSWLLRPRPEAFPAGTADLDSARLEVARATLAAHELTYQHGVDHVLARVQAGEASAGVLLRPASVAQIAATATGGERMPPKTTYFAPKLRTGLVFHSLG